MATLTAAGLTFGLTPAGQAIARQEPAFERDARSQTELPAKRKEDQ